VLAVSAMIAVLSVPATAVAADVDVVLTASETTLLEGEQTLLTVVTTNSRGSLIDLTGYTIAGVH